MTGCLQQLLSQVSLLKATIFMLGTQWHDKENLYKNISISVNRTYTFWLGYCCFLAALQVSCIIIFTKVLKKVIQALNSFEKQIYKFSLFQFKLFVAHNVSSEQVFFFSIVVNYNMAIMMNLVPKTNT